MNGRSRKCAMRGFSMVELLIALVLGLIISAAVVQMFVASKTTQRMQEALARVQENGRFAIGYLANEIRMAGYMGCANLDRIEVNVIADPPASFDIGNDNSMVGHNNVASVNTWTAKANTDVLEIRRASSLGVMLTGNMTADNANIKITNNSPGFVAGDAIFITDCSSADLFRATNVSNDTPNHPEVTIAHANNRNTTNKLSRAYGANAEVMAFESVKLFIKNTGRTTPGGAQVPALFIEMLGAGSNASAQRYELVEGVEDMQLEYGVDTTGDRAADEYRTANAVSNWENVVSVRIGLLLRSTEEDVTPASGEGAQQISFNGSDISADGFLRQRFSAVVAIRNRLP